MYEEIPTSMEEFSKSIKAKAAAHGISCDISMDREAIARGLALEESDRKQKVAEILKRQPAAARAAERLVSAIAIQSVIRGDRGRCWAGCAKLKALAAKHAAEDAAAAAAARARDPERNFEDVKMTAHEPTTDNELQRVMAMHEHGDDFERTAAEERKTKLEAAAKAFPLLKGQEVVAAGLVEHKDLNGRFGIVVDGPSGAHRRYGVRFEGDAKPKAAPRTSPWLLGDCADVTRGPFDLRPWEPAADARLVHAALDAVGFHFVLEWRAGEGWRLLQCSTLNRRWEECHVAGYRALEWANPREDARDLGELHARLGRGRLLGDVAVRDHWARVLELRDRCHDVLSQALLPRLPQPLGPYPAGDDPERERDRHDWHARAARVRDWAEQVFGRADDEDLVETPVKQRREVAFVTGIEGECLFAMPVELHEALCAAYERVVGDRPTGFVYLHMLRHVGHAPGITSADHVTGGAHGNAGFTMRALPWVARDDGDDDAGLPPLEPSYCPLAQ
ncbi:hypothetical protein JL722_12264 [Aureococcus anophagefferens]|nr:hypothetical protein JL722_12264 [Aureococcus anophagefferens]